MRCSWKFRSDHGQTAGWAAVPGGRPNAEPGGGRAAVPRSGAALTAGTGATLRELMDRMGHSSTRAALIYLHGSDARQRQIAKSLSKVAQRELRATRSGTQRARRAGNDG